MNVSAAVLERERLTDRLTDELRDVASQISQLQARQAELIARLEDEGSTGTTMTRWVGWQAGLTPGEARVAVRVSRSLRDLPVIAEAFGEGRLSQGVVSALASVATPDNEAELVETSKVATGSQLTRLVRAMKRIVAEDQTRETPDEHLWLTSRDDGM